jgi:hypothetical protein
MSMVLPCASSFSTGFVPFVSFLSGKGNMFGRDGLLAHPYMLGPNGQSNGCVSFSDYPAFLSAFLRGEVDRLVVVQRLATAPTPRAGPEWLPEPFRNLFFKPS